MPHYLNSGEERVGVRRAIELLQENNEGEAIKLLKEEFDGLDIDFDEILLLLNKAYYQGKEEFVKFFLEQGKRIKGSESRITYANIDDAFSRKDVESLELFLQAEVNIKYITEKIGQIGLTSYDSIRRTFANSAVGKNCSKLLEVMIITGLDLKSHGNSLSHIATMFDSLDCLEMLINKGANLRMEQTNLAHVAAKHNRPKCLNFLIKTAIDLNRVDHLGRTPVHVATEHDNHNCLDLLIKAGVDLNKVDHFGRTPAHVATAHDSHNCLDLLIKADADLNKVDHLGRTPVHVSTAHDSHNCLDLLIKADADLNKVDRCGRTPAHIAIGHDSHNCLDLLIKAGVDLNEVDHFGRTPAKIAIKRNHPKCIKLLEEALKTPSAHPSGAAAEEAQQEDTTHTP